MSNWGKQADYSNPNWTLRTPRKMKKYSQYTNADQKIPFDGWILAALVLFAVFGFLPLLHWIVK